MVSGLGISELLQIFLRVEHCVSYLCITQSLFLASVSLRNCIISYSLTRKDYISMSQSLCIIYFHAMGSYIPMPSDRKQITKYEAHCGLGF